MNYIVRTNDFFTCVKVSWGFFDLVDRRVLNIYKSLKSDYFFKLTEEKFKSIEFRGSTGKSISECLNYYIAIDTIFGWIKDYLYALKELRDRSYLLNYLICDLQYVFVNEETKKLMFIYVPLADNTTNVFKPELFIKMLINSITRIKDEDKEKLKKLSHYINTMMNWDENCIVEYIDNLLKYKDLNPLRVDMTEPIDDVKTEPIDDEKTEQYEEIIRKVAKITRLSTDECTYINKSEFIIGKKDTNDYQIKGNPRISREHAKIIKKNDEFYYVDLGSLNHSYIREDEVMPNIEIKLNDGDIIRMADEEFKFHF